MEVPTLRTSSSVERSPAAMCTRTRIGQEVSLPRLGEEVRQIASLPLPERMCARTSPGAQPRLRRGMENEDWTTLACAVDPCCSLTNAVPTPSPAEIPQRGKK
jgi:hypothetical protein